ncbi:MAG: heavy-metal-associated domain-containing protein [Erysipelotrichaceae bacterium]|nr:heavy-metal-associated domain-containing protein [Erysipelotrichaceae bacterium]
MDKVVLKIDGMACGMCEAHMNDTVRKVLPEAGKVRSSYKRGETEFLYEGNFDKETLIKAIRETGYECQNITIESYQKKGLFGR